ncbi:hypothetical protein [Syntrophomonas palmitatica]|uniref:hypothetical protein n=1 Tax=Syntrophomonas palmitatica TaxID=402877 RepID=UPI0006CF65F2|nr:hypothetical protein [Syntrophomonas palmitatica]
MRRIGKITGIILALLLITTCFNPQVHALLSLPDHQQMVVGESSHIKIRLPAQLANSLVMQVINPSRNVFAPQEELPVTINRDVSGYEIVALKPGKAMYNCVY